MSIRLTQEEFNDLFRRYPKVRKAASGDPSCPYCGNGLTPRGLYYWNKMTEAGTGYCWIEIKCDVCTRIIWSGRDWYSPVERRDELIRSAAEMLIERIDFPSDENEDLHEANH